MVKYTTIHISMSLSLWNPGFSKTNPPLLSDLGGEGDRTWLAAAAECPTSMGAFARPLRKHLPSGKLT